MAVIGKGHGSNEVLYTRVFWRRQMNSHIHAEYLHSHCWISQSADLVFGSQKVA